MRAFITRLLESIGGCRHAAITWPQTTKAGTHVNCLDCGRQFPYDWNALGGTPALLVRPKITAPRQLHITKPGHWRVTTPQAGHRFHSNPRDCY